ncbi:Hpt domain-containing protein [Sulfurisoma sediminicola]|uniref:Hpt domain-containing protein n=1 Tax=Sulfurisoma sediminicola TaxID=1381557 RepID=A0A497XJ03_9PROT|nr:Hpt domain-containing protein [Sulfurisoma sediminicola]RLJ67881.1 Hpt domain-containing protein [Sulfurisoma sediminicola]
MNDQTAVPQGDFLRGVFDRAEMMENFAGDAELFVQIAEIFIDDVPLQLAAMQAAQDSGNLETLRAAAHKLKGSVATFAARAALTAAKALEQACKDADAGRVPALAAAVQTETARLTAALRTELGR